MKPPPFDYHRPASVAEAAQMLADLGDDAKVLAGGQSLVPMLSLRLAYLDHLVDISRLVELKGVERSGDVVRIGAGTTEATVERDQLVAEAVPLMARATPFIGHAQIRNRGTVGGSIAHADPAAEYPAVVLALDAEAEATSPRGTRTIAAEDLFTGLWSTALDDDEILVGLRFPVWTGRCGFAIEEFARRHGDFAIAGAVVAVEIGEDDLVKRCGIGLIGLGSTPLRATAAEDQIIGRPVGEVTGDELGRLATEPLDNVPADLNGSAVYRTHVGAAMVARAWDKASSEARNGTNTGANR
ncbi:MAG TPA: xanthine dehydrogenase family protein subunit M [Microthrixaceae bacterium]|nr:xanthine dehydrogenase family protein subunit M [Microthrixaceae bacterium]